MAKKAPILNKNYNPIASRLKDFNAPPQEEVKADNEDKGHGAKLDKRPTVANDQPKKRPRRRKGEFITKDELATLEREETIFIDDTFKLNVSESKKRCEIKIMCSSAERDRWHEFSKKITGRRNSLSNVVRALLLVLEDSDEQIEKVSESIKELQTPPRGDSLKTILYEKKIAHVIWEAVRRSSRTQK